MDRNQQKGPGTPKSRWVWDRARQAWVEIVEAPVPTEPAREEKAAAPAHQRDIEIAPAIGVPVEAEPELAELEYKGAWARTAAIIIDIALLYLVWFIITTLAPASAPWVAMPLGFVYFVGFWWWRGQTPGKMLLRARIVRTDGNAIGLGNALLRWVFYLIPFFDPILFLVRRLFEATWLGILIAFLIAILGWIILSLSARKRGVHDVIAGTCVVSTRTTGPMGNTTAEKHSGSLGRGAA